MDCNPGRRVEFQKKRQSARRNSESNPPIYRRVTGKQNMNEPHETADIHKPGVVATGAYAQIEFLHPLAIARAPPSVQVLVHAVCGGRSRAEQVAAG